MTMSTAATNTAPTPVPAVSKKEIVVTASASEEIARQRAKRGTPNARIRVGVRGGGCTGFTYVFEWADEVKPTELERRIAETQEKISRRPAAFPHLIATSSRDGTGIDELRATIAQILTERGGLGA